MRYTNYKLLLVTVVIILLCFIDLAMACMYKTDDEQIWIDNILPACGNYELIDIGSDKNGKVSVQNTHKISLQEAYDPSKNLEKYGRQLVDSTENNAITLSNVLKTTEQPMRAYKLQFKTNVNALMSESVTNLNSIEYWTNLGKTKSWHTKFCTDELKAIMTCNALEISSTMC